MEEKEYYTQSEVATLLGKTLSNLAFYKDELRQKGYMKLSGTREVITKEGLNYLKLRFSETYKLHEQQVQKKKEKEQEEEAKKKAPEQEEELDKEKTIEEAIKEYEDQNKKEEEQEALKKEKELFKKKEAELERKHQDEISKLKEELKKKDEETSYYKQQMERWQVQSDSWQNQVSEKEEDKNFWREFAMQQNELINKNLLPEPKESKFSFFGKRKKRRR